MGAAGHHNKSVSAHYQRHYSLGLIPTEQNDWIRIVSPRLHKPCPFLKKNLYTIYPVRPLACILFPEYLVSEGRFEAEAEKAPFRDFLCLKRPIPLSPERAAIMQRLKTMWEPEVLISSYYLFNASPCYIDFSNLTKELAQAAGTLRDAEVLESSEPRATISNQVMENFLQKHIAGCHKFDGVSAEINRLNNLFLSFNNPASKWTRLKAWPLIFAVDHC
jgi:Fe-S-cluster containining protein